MAPSGPGGPIVTLTLNPALDVSTSVPVVTPSHKLRCQTPRYEPGGGGINVSRVCHRLGQPSVAVLPLGGPVGRRVADLLADDEIPVHAIEIANDTRESISVSEEATGQQFRFVLPGPTLSGPELTACRTATVEAAAGSSCVVVSGSLPEGVDPGILGQLVAALPEARVVIDTSGPALAAALDSGAHLVKPSARELSQLVGRPLETETEVTEAAVEVHERGRVRAVVASIGAGGAIMVDDDGVRRVRAPAVDVRSAVGAGDSMVAGLAVGLQRGLSHHEALALGVAAGTATVMTDGTGLCRPADVERLLTAIER